MKKIKLTYNQALIKIEEILQEIENDEIDVDIISQKVKEMSDLIKFCKAKLKKTESEIENIVNDIE